MNVDILIEISGQSLIVGELNETVTRGSRTTSFTFSDEWLSNPDTFEFDPNLTKSKAPHYPKSGKRMFSSIGDSAPDTWGRKLLDRREIKQAEKENRARRTLSELDYLMGVADITRLGAFRFIQDGEYFGAITNAIPTIVSLGDLLEAANNVDKGEETEDDLILLFAPGSSLGGARPKASVTDQYNSLFIAKFPKGSDGYSVERWEAIAMDMAKDVGLEVCDYELKDASGQLVYLTRRFDRVGGKLDGDRIPFISAMALTDHDDGDDDCSYLELSDIITGMGASPQKDLPELFRRMIFSVLISNVDDHFRNHGFLWFHQKGWKLSPLYDVNPVYNSSGILRTNIDYDNSTASITLLLEVAKYFAFDIDSAKSEIKRICDIVLRWETYAKRRKAPRSELELMRPAFEHSEIEMAKSF